MININDIYWVAGMIEGEGTIFLSKNSPGISVTSTDKDVMQRVAKIMMGYVNDRHWHNKKTRVIGYKPAYVVVLYGRNAIQWMMTIYPIMGERRKEKIREVIGGWKLIKFNYCRKGLHEFTVDNTYMTSKGRTCRECKRIAERNYNG